MKKALDDEALDTLFRGARFYNGILRRHLVDILPCLEAGDSYGATHDQPHA
jgi:hypothetical protein